ncbi:nuclear transport factor 2 family protein [Sphingomonas profundi]|uniref:nuclear transport factor 2 family protein n=1 Tax=Alterirhizorhabdus profundi TaxID=2681549 RepID=UPI0012E8B072|nr:nuclear transport factor 2 family protein [Sphingomonas profundi]
MSEIDAGTVRRLVDEADIRDVLGRYASAVDWMNWPVAESLFWDDAEMDFGDMFRGSRADFMPFLIGLEEGYKRRMHLFGMPRIALRGDGADVELASITHVRVAGEDQRTDSFIYGRYMIGMERRGGVWRMTRLLFMLNQFQSHDGPPSDAGPINLADDLFPGHRHAPHIG